MSILPRGPVFSLYALAVEEAVNGARSSSVLITNPIHLAMAIRYRPGQDPLPILLAKGEGALARIGHGRMGGAHPAQRAGTAVRAQLARGEDMARALRALLYA